MRPARPRALQLARSRSTDNVFGDRNLVCSWPSVDIYVKSCGIVKVTRSKSEHLADSSAGIGSIRVIFFSSECVSPQGMELPLCPPCIAFLLQILFMNK